MIRIVITLGLGCVVVFGSALPAASDHGCPDIPDVLSCPVTSRLVELRAETADTAEGGRTRIDRAGRVSGRLGDERLGLGGEFEVAVAVTVAPVGSSPGGGSSLRTHRRVYSPVRPGPLRPGIN